MSKPLVTSGIWTGNVIISGLTATGKTTHCHILAGEFGLRYVSGSQVLLYMLNRFPIQARDFWVTDEAQRLWRTAQADRVDEELLRLEESQTGIVFDSLATPWVHQRPAFTIWLESSLPSRVMKSIISHGGVGHLSVNDLESRIKQKDEIQRKRFKKLYGFDLFEDRTPFDLVLDISSCIAEPTLKASLKSIGMAHNLIRAAVGWYLIHDPSFRREFQDARRHYSTDMVLRCPPGLSEDLK